VVMMTNGPAATIGEVLDVDLPRPRERLALASTARYSPRGGRVLVFLYHRQAKMAALAAGGGGGAPASRCRRQRHGRRADAGRAARDCP
jgi:hypothetical protein